MEGFDSSFIHLQRALFQSFEASSNRIQSSFFERRAVVQSERIPPSFRASPSHLARSSRPYHNQSSRLALQQQPAGSPSSSKALTRTNRLQREGIIPADTKNSPQKPNSRPQPGKSKDAGKVPLKRRTGKPSQRKGSQNAPPPLPLPSPQTKERGRAKVPEGEKEWEWEWGVIFGEAKLVNLKKETRLTSHHDSMSIALALIPPSSEAANAISSGAFCFRCHFRIPVPTTTDDNNHVAYFLIKRATEELHVYMALICLDFANSTCSLLETVGHDIHTTFHCTPTMEYGKVHRIAITTTNSQEISLEFNGKNQFSNIKLMHIPQLEDGEQIESVVGMGVYKTTLSVKAAHIDLIDNHKTRPREREIHIDSEFERVIEDDIIRAGQFTVTMDDIAGLSEAKRVLQEAVILPRFLPDFFTGIREPWKGILLFGPGTGKTMLAKAASAQADSTFYNCSTATLISKWHGDSSKIVRTLFRMARRSSPSIVFFDEIDCLMTSRGGSSEHEASRRLKSEILQQIDGMASCESDQGSEKRQVMILAATNNPWDIDEALRRRLEKRIFIPLPSVEARRQLFSLSLKSLSLSDTVNLDEIAAQTEGYSGSDITAVCRDAALMSLRKKISEIDPNDIKKIKKEDIEAALTMEDLLESLSRIKSSVSKKDVEKHQTWMEEFGSN